MDEKPTVQWLSSAEELPDALWRESFPPEAEGGWWYRALDHSNLGDQFTFYYGLIACGDKAIGIAPVFVMNVPIDIVTPPAVTRVLLVAGKLRPSLRYQRTLFVGSPCADEGTVGLRPGVRLAEVSEELQDALEALSVREHAKMIVWKDFPDAGVQELGGLIKARRMFTMPSYPSTVVHLPKGGFDDYLATLDAGRRYSLRKKLKTSKAMGALQSAVIQRPQDAELKEIFALFMQTYTKGKTKFERLGFAFFEQIARCEESHFITLRAPETGRLVAFMLCFRGGRKVINKFIGLDYALDERWFMYFRLWEAAVIWAMVIGADEIQSGQTVYRAKLDIGHQLVPLTNVCLNRNWFFHRLFAAVARTVSWSTLDADLKLRAEAQARKGQAKG